MFKSGYTPGSIAGLLHDEAEDDSTNTKVDEAEDNSTNTKVAKLFSTPQRAKPAKVREQQRKRKVLELADRKLEDDSGVQKLKRRKLKDIAKESKITTPSDGQGKVPAMPEIDMKVRDTLGLKTLKQSDDEKIHADRKIMRLKAKLVKEKKKKTVFLGQLPTTITKTIIRQMLRDCGKVESIRFRSAAPANPKMPKKGVVARKEFHPKMNTFNAYVVFETDGAAKSAAKLNGMSVEGHHICVDYLGTTAKHDHKRSLFVGNLPFDAKEEDVREHFKECGEVTNVRLVRDKFTRIGKGFGYVLFQDKDSVDLALKFEGNKFKDRKLRVQRSTDPSNRTEKEKRTKSERLPKKLKKSSLDRKGISPTKKRNMEKDQSFDKTSAKQQGASRLKEKKKKKLRHRLDKKKKQKIANILTGKISEKPRKSKKDTSTRIGTTKGSKTSQSKQQSKAKKHKVSRDGQRKISSSAKTTRMHSKKKS